MEFEVKKDMRLAPRVRVVASKQAEKTEILYSTIDGQVTDNNQTNNHGNMSWIG